MLDIRRLSYVQNMRFVYKYACSQEWIRRSRKLYSSVVFYSKSYLFMYQCSDDWKCIWIRRKTNDFHFWFQVFEKLRVFIDLKKVRTLSVEFFIWMRTKAIEKTILKLKSFWVLNSCEAIRMRWLPRIVPTRNADVVSSSFPFLLSGNYVWPFTNLHWYHYRLRV